MSAEINGAKMFIYVVRHEHRDLGESQGVSTYILRSDHDPSDTELVKFLGLDYDAMHDTLTGERYSEDEIPTLPPKA